MSNPINPPTTPDEAYALTMQVVEQLKREGISANIKPCSAKNDAALVDRYRRPERVGPEKWVTVSFTPHSARQADRISDEASRLDTLGIYFDSGGCAGQRDWELDFSFKLKSLEKPHHAKPLLSGDDGIATEAA